MSPRELVGGAVEQKGKGMEVELLAKVQQRCWAVCCINVQSDALARTGKIISEDEIQARGSLKCGVALL